MAEKLKFELVSPERLLMERDVDRVTVPGTEGDFGVLAGHAPVMSTVRPGMVSVLDDGAETRLFVRGGFAEVTPQGLVILAEQAINLDEISVEDLRQQVQNAREDVEDAKGDEALAEAQTALRHLEQVLEAAET